MDFRILGPVELWAAGTQIDIGPPRQRSVLAILMLSPGRAVPVSTLIDQLWGTEPPEQARNTLYSYVARLRAVLRQAAGPDTPGTVRRTAGGYLLDVDPLAVDCHRFRQLMERSRLAGTDQQRTALVRDALAQWRGQPLAGLAGSWVEQTRHSLEQQRINAAVEWAELAMATGGHAEVIDRMHELMAEHPLAEALATQLVRALHRAGRSAEALDVYGITRERLLSELGAEPGKRLRSTYQEVLRATAAPAEPIARPTAELAIEPATEPAEVPQPAWHGLRPHLARLIGRADECARLENLLRQERLVTVTGTGGCGKTALALHVAQRVARRDGIPVLALALAPMTSAEQAARALYTTIRPADDAEDVDAADTADTSGPTRADRGQGDPMLAVERALGTRPWLLVLDNCEHLAGEVAGLASRLLGHGPTITVLATSRQPLSLTDEAVFALAPLAVPAAGQPADLSFPAAELFIQRVRQEIGRAHV